MRTSKDFKEDLITLSVHSTYMRQFYRNLKRKGKKEGFT